MNINQCRSHQTIYNYLQETLPPDFHMDESPLQGVVDPDFTKMQMSTSEMYHESNRANRNLF